MSMTIICCFEAAKHGALLAERLDELIQLSSHSLKHDWVLRSTQRHAAATTPALCDAQSDDEDGTQSWQWGILAQGALGMLADGIADVLDAVWGPEPNAFIPAVRVKGCPRQVHI